MGNLLVHKGFAMTYTHELLYLYHRGVAKAGEKPKVGGSSRDPKAAEPEKQTVEAPEASIQNPEDPANDLPPQIDATALEPMHTEINPAASDDPLSPKLQALPS